MTDEELAHYSAALDEIWRLRTALAYEADVLAAHLGYKSFPRGRQEIGWEQIDRMKKAVVGRSEHAYGGIDYRDLQAAREGCGLETLTRWEWENKRPAVGA